ncbi:MAG TPA: hypothetical protein DCM70_12360 [Rhodobacteraceae bacterium]|nr:hypothetical protein [Paracoccaceae bacterium]
MEPVSQIAAPIEVALFVKGQQIRQGGAICFWTRSKTVAAMACLKAFLSFSNGQINPGRAAIQSA